MNRIILTLFTLLLGIGASTAQEYGLYFMPDVYNATYLNPGLYPRQNVVVSLPSIHTSFNAIGLNKAKVFNYNEAEDVYYLNYADLLDKLDRDVTMKSSTVLDAFAVGFKVKKLFFSIGTNVCVEGDFTAPQDFFRTIWEGTADYVGTPLNLGPSLNVMGFQKIGVGANYSVLPNFSVGMRVNRLIGLASFQTMKNDLTITQNEEYYQTNFKVDYMVNYYAAGALDPLDQEVQGISNFENEFGEFDFEGNSIKDISNDNKGWSVDLGGEYFLNDKWSFAASVLNLGYINWKNQTQQLQLTEDYTYNGLEVDLVNDREEIDIDGLTDTLEMLVDFTAVSNSSYRQGLSPRVYLSARYQPLSFVTFGGLFFNEFTAYGGTFTALSLSSRVSLGRVLSVGGLYTLQSGTHNNFGLNTALKLGPVQIYAIADNVAPLFNQERLDGTNFRVGLNLTFGRKKMDQELAANLGELDTEESKDIAEVPAAIITQSDSTSVEEVIPGNEAEESVVEVPTEPEGDNEARKDKAAKVKKDRQRSQPTKVEANSIVGAEAVKVYRLQSSFKDILTTQPVEAVYVDVYRIDNQGNKILVRTGRFENGELDMNLNLSYEQHEVLAAAHGYEPITFTFQPQPENKVEPAHYFKTTEVEVQADPAQNVVMIEEENVVTAIPQNPVPPVAEEEEELLSTPQPIIEEEPMIEEIPVEEIAPNEMVDDYSGDDEMEEEITIEEVPESEMAAEPVAEPAPRDRFVSQNQRFYITQRTSLRSHATSASDVLTRLAVGAEIELLEQTNEWWWYVSYKGRQGWVKAHLLERL